MQSCKRQMFAAMSCFQYQDTLIYLISLYGSYLVRIACFHYDRSLWDWIECPDMHSANPTFAANSTF